MNSVWLEDELRQFFRRQATRAFTRHRLDYIHMEDDGTPTLVCVCHEGFSVIQNWNLHVQRSFEEVNDGRSGDSADDSES